MVDAPGRIGGSGGGDDDGGYSDGGTAGPDDADNAGGGSGEVGGDNDDAWDGADGDNEYDGSDDDSGSGGGFIDSVTDTVDDVTAGVSDTVNDVTSGVGDTVNDVTSGVGDTIDDVTSGVGDVTDDVTDTVGAGVDDVTDTVGAGVSDTVDEVTGTVDDVTDDVTGGVSDATDDVTDSVSDTSGDVADGIYDVAEDVGADIDNVAGGVDETVSDVRTEVGGTVDDVTAGVTDAAADVTTSPAVEQSDEQFGDFDYSAGLGDPEVDEVEQFVDSLPQRAEGAVRPASEELFERAGRTGGANALDALGFENAAEQYDQSVRTFGREIAPQTAAGLAEIPGQALEAGELIVTQENADQLPNAAVGVAQQQAQLAQDEPATFAAGIVGGGAVGAGFGRFVGTTRVGEGRSGAALRAVDIDPGQRAVSGLSNAASSVRQQFTDTPALGDITDGVDAPSPTDTGVVGEVRGTVTNLRRRVQRGDDDGDVTADPVTTGRETVGTDGVGSILDADTVDEARGVTGPSLGSRVRGSAERTADDVGEAVGDAVSPFVPEAGETGTLRAGLVPESATERETPDAPERVDPQPPDAGGTLDDVRQDALTQLQDFLGDRGSPPDRGDFDGAPSPFGGDSGDIITRGGEVELDRTRTPEADSPTRETTTPPGATVGTVGGAFAGVAAPGDADEAGGGLGSIDPANDPTGIVPDPDADTGGDSDTTTDTGTDTDTGGQIGEIRATTDVTGIAAVSGVRPGDVDTDVDLGLGRTVTPDTEVSSDTDTATRPDTDTRERTTTAAITESDPQLLTTPDQTPDPRLTPDPDPDPDPDPRLTPDPDPEPDEERLRDARPESDDSGGGLFGAIDEQFDSGILSGDEALEQAFRR